MQALNVPRRDLEASQRSVAKALTIHLIEFAASVRHGRASSPVADIVTSRRIVPRRVPLALDTVIAPMPDSKETGFL